MAKALTEVQRNVFGGFLCVEDGCIGVVGMGGVWWEFISLYAEETWMRHCEVCLIETESSVVVGIVYLLKSIHQKDDGMKCK